MHTQIYANISCKCTIYVTKRQEHVIMRAQVAGAVFHDINWVRDKTGSVNDIIHFGIRVNMNAKTSIYYSIPIIVCIEPQ